ncbi:MAG TPA: oligosaccharide flippase family protein [Candidatus Methylomirabilis sp.]|nr:oligosaccharide flippase family protein [Candidatus Methylomirabilis sp.]
MDWKSKRAELADWLTQTLKLDVRFYGRSFAFLSFGHASGVVRGIATTFLMARWLPKETLGEFRYVLALFGMAGVFAISGMSSSVIRAIAKGDTVVAHLAFRQVLKIAPLGTLALLVAAAERAWHGETNVAIALAVTAVAFTPYAVSGFYGHILTGQERIRDLTRLAVLNNLLFAAAFVIALRFNHDLLTVTLAYFGFDILIRGAFTWRELRRLPKSGSAGDHLQLGHHLSAVGVFQTIATQLDQVLVQRFGGYSALASFSVATVIPEQIKDFANSVSGTLLQRMSRHEKTEAHVRATRRHFWIAMAGSIAIVAGYAVVAPFAVPWLFPQYRDAVLPSIVYALGLLALPAVVGLFFFQAHHEIKRLWRFYVTTTVLQVATNIALIPAFGGWGAIWSKTVTRLAGLSFSYPTLTPESKGKRTDTVTVDRT